MNNRYELVNRFVTSNEAIATRNRALQRRSNIIDIVDPVDERWAQLYSDTRTPNNYYDYYYSGEDIKVYVAEISERDRDFGNLPIHNLAFNVSQEKTPVYGFWSYTYDAVMRGTRLVTGSFTLVSRHPNYMKDLLTKAASNRSLNAGRLRDNYPAPGEWRMDDENIDRYWGKHLDASVIAQGSSEWSIHPPFGLVVVYGVQDTSVEEKGIQTRYNDMYHRGDNALMKDHNQRLVESYNADDPSRIIIDGCELTGVSRAYQPGGALVAEQYEFFGRDIIVPQPEARRGNDVNIAPNVPGSFQ